MCEVEGENQNGTGLDRVPGLSLGQRLDAEYDGQPAGFVQLILRDTYEVPVMTPRTYAVVDSLYVHSELRQLGLGEMLMMSGEEWALENGADSLVLNVYDFNTAARGLYGKLGYQTLSRKMLKWLE